MASTRSTRPAPATPEVGGYTTHDAQRVLRRLSGCNLVGEDVVEIFPPLDPSRNTALVDATLMFEIMCLLPGARVARAQRFRPKRQALVRAYI